MQIYTRHFVACNAQALENQKSSWDPISKAIWRIWSHFPLGNTSENCRKLCYQFSRKIMKIQKNMVRWRLRIRNFCRKRARKYKIKSKLWGIQKWVNGWSILSGKLKLHPPLLLCISVPFMIHGFFRWNGVFMVCLLGWFLQLLDSIFWDQFLSS